MKPKWTERDCFHLDYPDWEQEWWVYRHALGDWRIMQVTSDGVVEDWEETFKTANEAMGFADTKILEWETAE